MKHVLFIRLMLAAVALLLTACESLTPTRHIATPVAQATPSSSTPLDSYVDMLSALSGADRVRQTDVFFDVERAYTQAPTTLNQLRYALALAVPGHPSNDPIKAKKLLEQSLATPERLTSNERALCALMLNIADQWLKLQTENRRLAATVDDKSRSQSNSDRRFQAQTEEISKLRKALDAAQQKLDAIKDLEKSISERSASSPGTRESGNRDTPSQTQTPPAGR
jgi:hypothetical protein